MTSAQIKAFCDKQAKRTDLPVLLQKGTHGYGVFANADLAKNQLVAIYTVEVVPNSFTAPTGHMYDIDLVINGKLSTTKYGALTRECLVDEPYENTVPYWGPFCNEPSDGKRTNVKLIKMRIEKMWGRTFYHVGVRTTKKVEKGTELVWDYGKHYRREYDTTYHKANVIVLD